MVTDENFDLLCSVAYFDSSMRVKGERFGERMAYLDEIKEKIEAIAEQNPRPQGFGMLVSKSLGIPPGPELGEKVEEIHQMVLSGKANSWNDALKLIR